MRAFHVVFGQYGLNLQTGELRKSGHPVRLSPQPARLLCLLASRPGQLVTRSEARRQLWGEIEFLDFELGLNHCLKRIRAVLCDDPRRPRYIETVPRQGFRFVAVVEGHETSGTPSLAVLPFENLNRDPDGDGLADGFTEATITELAAIPRVRVISRQSVLHLRGTALTLPEIARKLNVDVIVMGSVFKQGLRIRVNAHLVQGEPERQIWARSYEADRGEALVTQRELAHGVAEAAQQKLLCLDAKMSD